MHILAVFIIAISAKITFSAPVAEYADRPISDAISSRDELPIVEPDREAILEAEGIPSKGLAIYDTGHLKLSQTLRSDAKPIVDTIQEHEKYGNDGDRPWDRAIVNGYETLSNFLNKVIDTPGQYARSFSKAIVAQLDILGAKIVGLA